MNGHGKIVYRVENIDKDAHMISSAPLPSPSSSHILPPRVRRLISLQVAFLVKAKLLLPSRSTHRASTSRAAASFPNRLIPFLSIFVSPGLLCYELQSTGLPSGSNQHALVPLPWATIAFLPPSPQNPLFFRSSSSVLFTVC